MACCNGFRPGFRKLTSQLSSTYFNESGPKGPRLKRRQCYHAYDACLKLDAIVMDVWKMSWPYVAEFSLVLYCSIFSFAVSVNGQ